MRYPQLLVYEADGRIAETFRRLREQDRRCKFALREPRGVEACVRLLARGGPGVLILKCGKDLLREMTLLDQVTWACPQATAIVVADTENPLLANLAWDLGAAYVLFPPLPRDWLAEIAERYLIDPAQPGKASAPAAADSDSLILPDSES